MSFGRSVRTVLTRCTDFSGRARRSEYWYWSLVVTLSSLVVAVIDGEEPALGRLLRAVLVLVVLLPTLAVTVRRLHDTGRPGWVALVGLVPVVGALVLLVLLVVDSTPGPNRYGPAPATLAGGAPGR